MEKLNRIYEEKNNELYRNNLLYGFIFDRKDNYYIVERTTGTTEIIRIRYIYG